MDIQQIAVWLLSFLSGSVASPIIQWLKLRLGWNNGNAYILTIVAATLFAIVSMIASGELLPGSVTWSQFPAILFLVLQGAVVTFRKWYKESD